MTLKKVGTYGQIVGGMPLGLGEENWWTKIGQDYMQDVPDAQPVSPGNVGDIFGPMPLGYGSPTYLQDIGKAVEPVTSTTSVTDPNERYGVWGNNKWLGLDEIKSMGYGLDSATGKYRAGAKGETLNTQNQWWLNPQNQPITSPTPSSIIASNEPDSSGNLTGDDLRNYWRGKNQWTDDNTYINKKLTEWNNLPGNMPTTAEGMAAKLGLVYTPDSLDPTPPGDDVKYEMTPFGGRTAFQSSFDPSLYGQPIVPYNKVAYQGAVDPALLDQRNRAAMEAARLGALPGLQESLAGAREDAARAGGGEATGMFSEFSRKPLETFGKQLAVTSAELEAKKADTLLNESIRKNQWEMDQAVKSGDFETQQKLENQKEMLNAQREDKKAKVMWDMEQDVKEHDWLRGETAKLFGANYAQDLNDKEWERNNAADVAKSNIEIAFKNGEINRDEAWKRWSATNDERLRKLTEQRADLEWQRTIAQQEKMFDKQAILSKEIAALDREAQKQIADNQEDASMWGAIGSAAVTIGAAALFSDRRLKENIKRISTNLLGIGIYEFNYVWDKIKHIGVMADEVKQVMPEAVIRHNSGFDMVNYSMLGGDINGS